MECSDGAVTLLIWIAGFIGGLLLIWLLAWAIYWVTVAIGLARGQNVFEGMKDPGLEEMKRKHLLDPTRIAKRDRNQ